MQLTPSLADTNPGSTMDSTTLALHLEPDSVNAGQSISRDDLPVALTLELSPWLEASTGFPSALALRTHSDPVGEPVANDLPDASSRQERCQLPSSRPKVARVALLDSCALFLEILIAILIRSLSRNMSCFVRHADGTFPQQASGM